MRRPIRFEKLESRRLLASDWQNAFRPRDVDNDKVVTPLDALIGINRLNTSPAASELPTRESDSLEPFVDVNGDGHHTPLDVLLVVNSLNGGLLVSTALVNDTGTGLGADQDRLTNDLSIQGSTQIQVDYLEIQLNQQGEWHSIVDLLHADGTFTVSRDRLEQLHGGPLLDGDFSVDVRAGQGLPGSGVPDRTLLELRRDATSPKANFAGDIVMSRPDQIVVPFDEVIVPDTFSPAQVYLYDITWGQNSTTSEFGLDGNYPRFPVQPQSITLAESGRAIIVVPPANNRSIKYLIEYGPELEDAAGNRILASSAIASYFAPVTDRIQPGDVITTPLTSVARIREYRLDIETNEVLVWGDRSLQSRSRIELYDVHGQLLHEAQPWTMQHPYASAPAFWPVTAGQYRLRVVEPPINESSFHILPLSSLPELPQAQEQQEKYWQYNLFKVQLQPGESVFAQRLSSVTSAMLAAINPSGQFVELQATGADTQFFQADVAGTYIVAMNGIGFQQWKTSSEFREPTSEPVIEGNLTNGTDRIFASFVTKPGWKYLLDIESLDPDLKFSSTITDTSLGLKTDAQQWLFRAPDSAISFGITRSQPGVNAAEFKIRLTPLVNVQPLPVNSPIAAPALGQANYYYLPSASQYSRLLIEGSHKFLLVPDDFGNAIVSQRSVTVSNLESRYLLRVQATSDTTPWFVRGIETVRQPLTTSTPTPLTFTHGWERYELETFSSAGRFMELTVLNGTADKYQIALLDENGQEILPFNPLWNNLWQTSLSMVHRLVIAGKGTQSIGELTLQVNTESDWPELNTGVIESVQPGRWSVFRLPANQSEYYLDAMSSPLAATWSIFNQNGLIVTTQPLYANGTNRLLDFDLILPAANDHYLFVDVGQGPPSEPLTFRLNAPATETRTVTLNTLVAGSLATAGDKARLQWSLRRGERVKFSELVYNEVDIQASFHPQGESFFIGINQAFLVPTDGIYELVLVNKSPTMQSYSALLTIDDTAQVGRASAGFGTIRDGSVAEFAEQIVVSVQVQANTMAAFDWLESQGNTDLKFSVRKIAGETVVDALAIDRIFTLEDAGVYQIVITNLRQQSQTYRFVLRDLADADLFAVGQPYSQTIGPFEFRLLRSNISEASELVLVNKVPGATANLISTLPGGQTGATYAAGELLVLLSNETSEPLDAEFSVVPLSVRPILQLGHLHDVTLESSTNLYRFQSSGPMSLEVKTFSVGAEIMDVYGVAVMRNERVFFLPSTGDYILKLFNPQNTALKTTVELRPNFPTQTALPFGTTIQKAIEPFDEHRYTFSLDQRSLILLNISSFERSEVQLMDATGREFRLYDETTSSFLLSTSVQELPVGDYTLRIAAGRAQTYSLTINKLSSALPLSPGYFHDQLAANESVKLYRATLPAGQALVLDPGFQNSAQYQVYLPADRHQPRLQTFIPANGNGNAQTFYLFVYGAGTTIDLNMETMEQIQFNLIANEKFEGTLPGPYTQHLIHFTIDSTDVAFTFQSSNAVAWLSTPFGARVPLGSYPMTDLPLGDYTLEVSTESQPTNYRFQYQLLHSAGPLPLDDAGVESGTYYRLDLAEDFRGTWLVLDDGGQPVSLNQLEIWRRGVNTPISGEIKFLKAGTYWMRVFVAAGDSEPLHLRLQPTILTAATAAIGEEVIIDLGESYTIHRLRMAIPAASPIIFAQLNLPTGVVGRYRFLSPLLEDRDEQPFTTIQWDATYVWPTDGTLELQFDGTGVFVVQIIDLNRASVLSSEPQTYNLDSTTNRAAWRLPVDRDISLLFEQLHASSSEVRWRLLNAAGQELTIPSADSVWSIVNTMPIYLVVSRFAPASPSGDPIEVSVKLTALI